MDNLISTQGERTRWGAWLILLMMRILLLLMKSLFNKISKENERDSMLFFLIFTNRFYSRSLLATWKGQTGYHHLSMKTLQKSFMKANLLLNKFYFLILLTYFETFLISCIICKVEIFWRIELKRPLGIIVKKYNYNNISTDIMENIRKKEFHSYWIN